MKKLAGILNIFTVLWSDHVFAENKEILDFLRKVDISYMQEGFCTKDEWEEMVKNDFSPRDRYVDNEEENYMVFCGSQQVRSYKRSDNKYVFIVYTTMGNHAQYEPHAIYRFRGTGYVKLKPESIGLPSSDEFRINWDGSVDGYRWDGSRFYGQKQ